MHVNDYILTQNVKTYIKECIDYNSIRLVTPECRHTVQHFMHARMAKTVSIENQTAWRHRVPLRLQFKRNCFVSPLAINVNHIPSLR